ncbi:MAG TPA: DUF202 domain-containing protein [Flavobacteriales bacterium]
MDQRRKDDIDLQLAQERTDLAAQRTREAADRTLMAWIRTALAMIGFGFSVFKVFQFLMEEKPQAQHDLVATRVVTLALVALGSVLLILAMFQYHFTLRELRKGHDLKPRFPLALWAAVFMALIGVYATVNILAMMGMH